VSAPAQQQGAAEFDGSAPQRAVSRPVSSPGEFDPDRAWRLHPQVAVRPEPFGALLYHFGTRKLSFLKNRTILAVVQSLADHPDARAALRAAGVEDAALGPYLHALGVLAGSNMLVPAGAEEAA
jgi:mycofactocin biosynthesis protein MftB